MEPIDGFNAGSDLPARMRAAPGYDMTWACRWPTPSPGWEQSTTSRSDCPTSASLRISRAAGPRWLAELESYNAFDNYPGPDIGDVSAVASWLEQNTPTSWAPGIMHGDYHAANVMFSPTGPDVVAIVDWEMCTIGDPLVDLGWMLATWYQPAMTPC